MNTEKPTAKYEKITAWYVFYHSFVSFAIHAIMAVGMFDLFFYIAMNAMYAYL